MQDTWAMLKPNQKEIISEEQQSYKVQTRLCLPCDNGNQNVNENDLESNVPDDSEQEVILASGSINDIMREWKVLARVRENLFDSVVSDRLE